MIFPLFRHNVPLESRSLHIRSIRVVSKLQQFQIQGRVICNMKGVKALGPTF